MNVVNQSYEIMYPVPFNKESVMDIYKRIENAGRTCYKSEKTDGTEEQTKIFVKKLVESRHFAMLEHAFMTIRLTTDRGVSHEVVRHRIASYAQESQRYCNYSKGKFGEEITVISPESMIDVYDPQCSKLDERAKVALMYEWMMACEDAERHYFNMLKMGASPQVARCVLNNSTKTELVVTMNLREWRHFFELRSLGITGAPHPMMKELASAILTDVAYQMPEIFGDLLDVKS